MTFAKQLIDGLDHKLLQIEGNANTLRARLPVVQRRSLAELTDDYTRQSAHFASPAKKKRKAFNLALF